MLIDQKAPDFEVTACMPDNSFQTVRLSEIAKGKYCVLFFYPADFTFVCASEVPGFDKLLPEFKKRNCVVLGCSTDTKDAHKGWKLLTKEQGGLGCNIGYPLLGDSSKAISAAYDVLCADQLCCRGVFLIDKEGFVRAEHRNTDPLGRNLDEPLRLLDALQFHEKMKAEGNVQVCPANWKLGKKGIVPTIEGVAEFNKAGGIDSYLTA